MGIPKMLETQRLFRCGMCGEVFSVMADYEQYYRTEKPTACPNLRDPDRRCKVGRSLCFGGRASAEKVASCQTRGLFS